MKINNGYSNQVALTAAENLRSSIKNAGVTRVLLVLIVSVVTTLLFARTDYVIIGLAVSAIATFAFVNTLFSSTRYFNAAEYYSIPGSRDTNGKHVCIYCGSRGIHKHTNTEYGTGNKIVTANCKTCDTVFYSEYM
jgi:hypothetical protein